MMGLGTNIYFDDVCMCPLHASFMPEMCEHCVRGYLNKVFRGPSFLEGSFVYVRQIEFRRSEMEMLSEFARTKRGY